MHMLINEKITFHLNLDTKTNYCGLVWRWSPESGSHLVE